MQITYEVEVEVWLKVSKVYLVSAPNKTTAEAIAVEVAKDDKGKRKPYAKIENRNKTAKTSVIHTPNHVEKIISVRPTECKKQ
ncbi:MAG: hypothetical protein Unbinned5079contig1000_26 [Prokaryotic dsDNA virus sp.]|nr:MAG: hypothetical protein Unbinned5079contig1000_26 [Prokaryotic dsDNA virus sp.]|tara:strand:+ start:22184 stop:22432 length:249 start_codon:yes stop_codon:yes gene_type:complete